MSLWGFYERLGWMAASSSGDDVTFFKMGGVVFGLYGGKAPAEDAQAGFSPAAFTGVSLAHNCESEEQVDEVMACAESSGAKVMKPTEKPSGAGIPGILQIRTDICGRLPTIRSFRLMNTAGLRHHEP